MDQIDDEEFSLAVVAEALHLQRRLADGVDDGDGVLENGHVLKDRDDNLDSMEAGTVDRSSRQANGHLNVQRDVGAPGRDRVHLDVHVTLYGEVVDDQKRGQEDDVVFGNEVSGESDVRDPDGRGGGEEGDPVRVDVREEYLAPPRAQPVRREARDVETAPLGIGGVPVGVGGA